MAILDLLRLAACDTSVTYVHIISGQDIIIRDLRDFDDFEGSKQIFMNSIPVNAAPDNIKRRFESWMPALNVDIRNDWIRFLKGIIYLGQKAIRIKRKQLGDFSEIYYGLVWCSLPASAAHYIVDYCDSHNKFMTELMHTVIPEEFAFQTILMNSPYKADVVPHNLQYYDWHERNGSSPAYLDESDYEKIKKSGKYFARKVDLEISHVLIERLQTQDQ